MSWVGGKKALREEVVKRFPLFYERYVEVFGGGGWVLFHKAPGNDFEVYNDYNGLLANLYRCVRDKPDLLINALKYVLNSREDFDRARLALRRKRTTDIQRAAWFYQVIRQSYAAALTSFASQPHDIPKDRAYVTDLIIVSDPAIVDLFATQFQCAYQELGLFGPNQCEPNSFEKLDYEGKVLVLSPDTLKETYWTPQAQLWYAHDGFGCSPKAIGRSIRCTCLGDGEMTRWNRTDFVGVLKDEFLPEWAKEKLMELKGQEQNNDSPAMGGMTME